MAGWRPALRIARRTARRSLGRTLLIAVLIGLPVMGAAWLDGLIRTMEPTGERLADRIAGSSDGIVEVTRYKQVVLDGGIGWRTAQYRPPDESGRATRTDPHVDLAPLLPAGSRLAAAAVQRGQVEVKIDGIATSSDLAAVADDPLTKGTYRLDSGRLPAGPGEAAVSPALAKKAGLLRNGKLVPDAKLETPDGALRVVGLATTLDRLSAPVVWTLPASPLLGETDNGALESYLVDLPDGVDTAKLQADLAARGIVLTPRAWITDPPPAPSGGGGPMSADTIAAIAAVALVVGFGLLEVVLLAGTAFAVGIRRQTRELGLLQATGGTSRHVRRVVLAQGLVLGVTGAVGGILLAVLVLVGGHGLWERVTDQVLTGWDLRPLDLGVIAGIGVLSGLAAALVPARMAAKMGPLAALGGRFRVVTGSARINVVALLMVVGGVAAVLFGSAWLGRVFDQANRREQNPGMPADYVQGVTPIGPMALVLLGITLVVAGLVWMMPRLVATASRLGSRLPVSGRLALRDAGRHRHRTGPAAAAIMITVAGSVAASFAVTNSAAKDRAEYEPRTTHGDVVVQRYSGDQGSTKALVDTVRTLLPTTAVYNEGQLYLDKTTATQDDTYVDTRQLPCASPEENCTGYALQVVDPGLVGRLGGAAAADEVAALEAGKMVTVNAQQIKGGTVELVAIGEKETSIGRVPAVIGSGLPDVPVLRANLISTATAERLGRVTTYTSHLVMSRPPTEAELEQARRVAGSEDAIYVERGFQDYELVSQLIVLGVATVVTLFGVGISVALSAAEGRADLATLAALGAPPRRRRSLAAAQAWLLGQLGCLLGIAVGSLYGYTGHVAVGSPYFAVPWSTLLGVAIAVPALAALVAWGLSRSQLPMVRRAE